MNKRRFQPRKVKTKELIRFRGVYDPDTKHNMADPYVGASSNLQSTKIRQLDIRTGQKVDSSATDGVYNGGINTGDHFTTSSVLGEGGNLHALLRRTEAGLSIGEYAPPPIVAPPPLGTVPIDVDYERPPDYSESITVTHDAGTLYASGPSDRLIIWHLTDGTKRYDRNFYADLPAGELRVEIVGGFGVEFFSFGQSNAGFDVYTGDVSQFRGIGYLALDGQTKLTGDLSGLGPYMYGLALNGTTSLEGDVGTMPAIATSLQVDGMPLLAGDIGTISPIGDELRIHDCPLLYGSINGLRFSEAPVQSTGIVIDLTNCSGVSGVVYPYDRLNRVILDGTGVSKTDLEQSLVACENILPLPLNTPYFIAETGVPTITDPAAIAAVATMRSNGWVVLLAGGV